MLKMKFTQLLLASAFTLAAATSFAATADKPGKDKHNKEEKVIVSTQEQPSTSSESAADKATATQPAVETAAEEKPAKPAQ